MILPILASEFLWSLGQNVESAVYGHLGTSNLAAYTLTCPIQGLIVGDLSGLSAAAGVMVGKRLGKKEYDQAYGESKKIMYAGLIGAVLVSAILILMARVYTGLYRVDYNVKELGQMLLIVFEESDECILKVMVVNGKLVFTGKKQVVDVCSQKFSNRSGSWFMDVSNFRELDKILAGEEYQIKTAHPFFIPKDNHVCEMNGIEVKKYNQEEVLQFQGDDRFDEAFCFDENSPDVLAVAAMIDHEIVGMAGASADSPYFWQIGINVNKEFEGRHIASGLVSILKHDILEKGIVPYYGTSFSNLASQHVAAKAGFEVAWVELITEKI